MTEIREGTVTLNRLYKFFFKLSDLINEHFPNGICAKFKKVLDFLEFRLDQRRLLLVGRMIIMTCDYYDMISQKSKLAFLPETNHSVFVISVKLLETIFKTIYNTFVLLISVASTHPCPCCYIIKEEMQDFQTDGELIIRVSIRSSANAYKAAS